MLHNARLKFHQQSRKQIIHIVSKRCRFSGALLVINSAFLSTASMNLRSWQTIRLKLVLSKEVQKYLIHINETISGIVQQVWGFFLQCISLLHFTKHFFHSFTRQWTKCLLPAGLSGPTEAQNFHCHPKNCLKMDFVDSPRRCHHYFVTSHAVHIQQTN